MNNHLIKIMDEVIIIPAIVLIFLMPSFDFYTFLTETYDSKRFSEIIILTIVLIGLIISQNKRIWLYESWSSFSDITHKFLITFFICVLLSASMANSKRYAFLELSTWAGIFIYSMFIAGFFRKYGLSAVKFIIGMAAIGAMLYETRWLVYLFSYLTEKKQIPSNAFIYSGFSNIRFFNQFHIWWIAPLSIAPVIFYNASRIVRILLYIIAIFWYLLLIKSSSLGALLALALTMVFFLLIPSFSIRYMMRYMVVQFISGGIVYFLVFKLIPYSIGRPDTNLGISANDFNDTARLYLWNIAVDLMEEHPFFGIGPMHYAGIENSIAAHPHNSLLQLSSELGLPATFLIMIIFIKGVWRLMQSKFMTEPSSLEALSLSAFHFSLIMASFYSMVSGVIVTPLSQLSLALVCGILLSNIRKQDVCIDKTKDNFILGAVSICLLTLFASALPDLLVRTIDYKNLISVNYSTPGPRYWQFTNINE